MNPISSRALSVARPVIQALTVANLLYAVCLALFLGWSFFVEGWPQRQLGLELVRLHPLAPLGLRVIVGIGVIGTAVVHVILRRLRAIVDSVRGGDPFILENAERLHAIAWSVLALELLRLAVMAIVAAAWEPGRLGGYSLAPWLAVLMLFVLAGVFANGARMRADLDGTV